MHFIRAFPIVLIIVLLFGCCFVFADTEYLVGSSPLLLGLNPYPVYRNSSRYVIYNTESVPIYTYVYSDGSGYNLIAFSFQPTSYISADTQAQTSTTRTIDHKYVLDGVTFYALNTYSLATIDNANLPVIQSDSLNNSLKLALSNPSAQSNSILSNITRFIVASNGWLTSIVGTVMANPLLNFILLFYFVGTAIGLLFRFRRN